MSLSIGTVGTVYKKPYFWRKGNRIPTDNDRLIIRIGSINNCDTNENGATQNSTTSSSLTTATKQRRNRTLKTKNDKTKKSIANNRIKTTNYTIISFLPKNLLEQFRRIANFYFLIMTIVAIVIDSPVSPWTSLAPLIFVISITAIKQGYEDYLRHKADNLVNRSYVTVIRGGVEIDIKCEDILQGDLVKASRDCDVPCDLILLKTSDPEGKCYVTTANLDGETNLKTLFVPKNFPNNVSIEKLQNIGTIECERPLADLYTFEGRLEIGPIYFWRENREPTFSDTLRRHKRALPLTADHLLLRGSRIKNTEWAIGCAVFTGQNTKLALNSQVVRTKTSSSENFINNFLIFFVVVMIGLVTYCYCMERFYKTKAASHDIYLGKSKMLDVIPTFMQEYLSFLILFNYLIPISLYVTIELHKFLGSLFLEWDLDLYDVTMNQQCLVNTSNLNEELGQIKILFSDKTGTLTKNEMILQQCSINGKRYKIHNYGLQEEERTNVQKLPQYNSYMLNFFQTLSVCHTAQVAEIDNNKPANDSELEKTFEFINSSSSSIELEEESVIKTETRRNTKQNEVCVPDNILDNLPIGIELRKSPILSGYRRGESVSGARKISFSDDHRLTMRPHFPIALNDFTPKIPSPLILDGASPFRFEYKRTISTKGPSDPQMRVKHGHRRTQSCSTPGSQANIHTIKNDLTRSPYNRSSSNIANTREYFAAPAYNEAALLERKESMRCSQNQSGDIVEQIDYQSSSPDEKALLEGCAKIGFLFCGESNSTLSIKLLNRRAPPLKTSNLSELKFERLHTLEFTSDRKRMSTIIRTSVGEIWLYTKGAESHVFPLCLSTPEQESLRMTTQKHINEFAKTGLRTLAVARRKLTNEEFQTFCSDITEAANALANRKNLIEAVQARIETDLELLGATAVEDALQDKVKDTIESLRYAGIMVWVLTGDKVETALNIAKSCGHIPENAMCYFMTECKEMYQAEQHLETLNAEITKNPSGKFSLLIDGMSLSLMLEHHPQRFRDTAVKCEAVLCCRLSPIQKCEVVKLMKTLPSSPITAAIGDGANDVSMIREAHVGLGIVGKEGRQAALCADYSFTNFCMLKKLLLVHGHLFSYRLSLLVLYFFYKNLVFMLIQVYFQSNNLFSTETIYESIFLTFYNVLYTSFPILLLSLTEKPYNEAQLMQMPSLYEKNAGNKRLTWKYFFAWIALSVYHSMVVYIFGYMMWNETNTILKTPNTLDLCSFGTFLIHNVVFIVTLKVWLIARNQTFIFLMTILLSILAFMASTAFYNILPISGCMFCVYNYLITSITFWTSNVLICVTALLPDYVIIALKMFNIKVRPADTISNGWNRFFKDQRSVYPATTTPTSDIDESTYL